MPKINKKSIRKSALASGPTNACQMQIKGRIWVERNGITYLSWARIELLGFIEEKGSVSAAAREMKMSYRHAWGLIHEMNQLAPAPLVETAVGGKGGGGARLTTTGKQAVVDFWQMVKNFQQWLELQKISENKGDSPNQHGQTGMTSLNKT
ncbi:MAG: LysR family transcriptional regulator [Desulfocapsaceae bacterium]|nr:LysR family transcriptional regulator [Desulfocapsaceae bacterium]